MSNHNPEYYRNYYAKHKEKYKVRNKNWRTQNREKFKVYQKNWYGKHKENQRERSAQRRAAINAIKLATGCVDCGYKLHPEALEFDHIRENKLFNISASTRMPMDDVLNEISKCELVCANCHRVRTYNRRINKLLNG